MNNDSFIPLPQYVKYPAGKMKERARSFREMLQRRRTVRHFSPETIPMEVIEDCLMAAGTAPSGANLQPWHFAVVTDPGLKKKIRASAEKEERDRPHLPILQTPWDFLHKS